MASRTFILFVSDDTPWRLAVVESGRAALADVGADAAPTPAARADAARTALDAAGYRGEPVTLALPSRWCLSAAIAAEGLPRKERRQAMLYRLEERLPLAAEDMAADFLAGPGAVLGVAVATRDVAPLAVALAERGVAVESVSPAAILALRHALGAPGPGAAASDADAVLWAHASGIELFMLSDGKPTRWSAGGDAEDIRLHLAAEALPRRPSPPGVWVIGPLPEFVERMARAGTIRIVGQSDLNLEEAAALAADGVRAGKVGAWIELRRDALAAADGRSKVARPLVATLAAAIVFLASICAALLWRSAHYQRAARDHVAAQEAVFKDALPGQAVPPNPVSRLASEERRMRAMSGDGPGSEGKPRQASALLVLREVLGNLPDDVRFTVSELRLGEGGEGRFTLQGQALSHKDADAVAAALRHGAGFEVEVRRSDTVAGVVGFTMSGSAEAGAPPEPGAGRRAGL